MKRLVFSFQPKSLDLMKRPVFASRSMALVEKSRLALVENCSKRNHLALEEGVMITRNLWVMTDLEPKEGLEIYSGRMKEEMASLRAPKRPLGLLGYPLWPLCPSTPKMASVTLIPLRNNPLEFLYHAGSGSS
jgi:hypothetical protein